MKTRFILFRRNGVYYYNPFLCRFINPDPTGLSSGMNFYVYASENPVSYEDPLGLQPSPATLVMGWSDASAPNRSAWDSQFQSVNQQATSIEVSAGAGVVVGSTGAGVVSLGAAGLVSVGVPQSVVTGTLLVTGSAGVVATGYSIYNNPSPNNIAFNIGGLGGGIFMGNVSANYVASALSPAGYQPASSSLSSDISMAWRGSNGNINPLAFLSDWLLPGATVGPMSTGPSTLGAAGTVAGAGSGTSSILSLMTGGSPVDWLGNPISSSSTGKPH